MTDKLDFIKNEGTPQTARRRVEWSPFVLGQRARRASVSLPSGLNDLLQFAEFSWQRPERGDDEEYFDQVAEAEAEKHAIRHVQTEVPYNPSLRGRKRSRTHYALGEGAYDPIRSDSEMESVDELSEVEASSPATRSKSKRERGKTVQVQVDVGTGSEDEINGVPVSSVTNKRSIAARRKRRISPLKLPNSNSKKNGSFLRDSSPTPSASSIKSFLREKLTTVSKSIPKSFMKRKADEYKLQVFVAILFLAIILLVGSIYVIHQEKELQKAYFNKIRFSSIDRRIRVSNMKNRHVLTGILGNQLTDKDKAWPCLVKDRLEGQNCLEWMNKARLYFSLQSPSRSPSIECYGVLWQALSPSFTPHDCFHMGEKKGFYFYGGGEMTLNAWPLNQTQMPLSPFTTGQGHRGYAHWGTTIRPFFVNSPGAAIQINSNTPLHVSINDAANSSMICIAAKTDDFAYPDVTAPVTLNYTICTGHNVRDVFVTLAEKSMAEAMGSGSGLSSVEDVHLAYALAKAPIWRILPGTVNKGLLSEESLLNHTDVIAALHLSEGFILLDETWQKTLGDLEMDGERFPGIIETFNITRRRGFKVALTIQPYFSTQSSSYLDGVKDGIWIKERHTSADSRSLPALTTYKSNETVVVLDVTSPSSRHWLERRLHSVVSRYGIDALFVDFGTAAHFPEFYKLSAPLPSPDDYKEVFLALVRRIGGVYTIGVGGATKTPKLPAFTALAPLESSWAGLQSIIPNVLSMGVAGFPFIMPGAVGGDFKGSGTELGPENNYEANKPERNLYIRWLELAHFLPVVQYTYLPSDYDSAVVEIARNLNVIRNTKVYNGIRKGIEEALQVGLPIIRPLWMTDPNEPACLKTSDEFMIGADILVAPVLTYNTTERNIYLPKGRWRDELDGTTTKGDKWLMNYRVRENQIAYFTKLPDAPSA